MKINNKISVIIPTFNAGGDLAFLLQSIFTQTMLPEEVIVVDSSSTDNTLDIAQSFAGTRIVKIDKSEFDHGRTRDTVLRQSAGDIVIFITQDALPVNNELILRLVAPLSDKSIAVVYARQIPKASAIRMEKLVRAFNYPEQSILKSKADIPKMGIKTFFSSNVCAAYNREIYLTLGGFDYPLTTNEDMFYAAKAIQNGYKIAYTADAQIFHSHNLTLIEQYRRNYLIGYEIEKHIKLLGGVKKEKEGIKLVKYVSKELLKHGNILSLLHFFCDCCARLLGSRLGRMAFYNEQKTSFNSNGNI